MKEQLREMCKGLKNTEYPNNTYTLFEAETPTAFGSCFSLVLTFNSPAIGKQVIYRSIRGIPDELERTRAKNDCYAKFLRGLLLYMSVNPQVYYDQTRDSK